MIPISEKTLEAAEAAAAILADVGVRVAVDRTNEKVGAKIRVARLDRVSYMLVLGAKEVEDGTVSIRRRDSEELTTMSLEDFIAKVRSEITERSL